MKRYIHVIHTIFFCALLSGCQHPDTSLSVKTIKSFKEVDFDDIKPGSLVLFDVDETLIVPASVTMRSKTKEEHQELLKGVFEKIFMGLPKPEEYYLSIWQKNEIPLLIEPDIVTRIKGLQNRGIVVLALTNLPTGSRGQITSLPSWRSEKLQQVDIDFSKANIPDKKFTTFPAKNGTYPVLYRGILATNGESKGAVLGALIDTLDWKPTSVFFSDDALKRVNEVADEMSKRHIPFKGYQYLGAEYVPGELNKELAALQLTHLAQHEEWLDDENARKRLVMPNTKSENNPGRVKQAS